MKKGLPHAGLLALLLLAAAPSSADWLVTQAGGRVETKGHWQVKGKLVVFTQQADGSLASLRLADVDLPASDKATAEAEEAKAQKATAAATPEPARKKLAVLTDDTIVHAKKPAPPADEASGDKDKKDKAADKKDQPAKAEGPVSVATWKRADLPGGAGIEIQGTLQNTSDKIAGNAGVEVQLFNEAGERVGTALGALALPSIEPKGTTTFRASFPGVFTFAQIKFETRGVALDLSPADKKPGEENPQQQ
ncbi:MAG TPA: FxLYD domain-containing protein [Thermoanaerobaculia bacterium]|nr:FxLYD domain-containing protein [Thermoanaerobaculia bacterium]